MPMRPLSVNLTDEQREHLHEIKERHGISMSGYVRTLLKVDMERPLIHEYAVVEEKREVTTTRLHAAMRAKQIGPKQAAAHIAVLKELKTAFARRRSKTGEEMMM